MYLQVTDGRAELASFVILCGEDSTILCFTQEEVDQQTATLDEAEVTYTVEAITWTDEQRQKVQGKTYATADEARQDLNGTRQPTELERLREENVDLKARLEDVEVILADVVTGGVV